MLTKQVGKATGAMIHLEVIMKLFTTLSLTLSALLSVPVFADVGTGCGFETASTQVMQMFADNLISEDAFAAAKGTLEASLHCLLKADAITQSERALVRAKINSIEASIVALESLRNYRASQ